MQRARPAMRGRAAATAAAVTGALLLALIPAPPATAADRQVTLDVLRVVDGDHVVETVIVPAAEADATVAELAARPDVVTASVQVSYSIDGTPDPFWEVDDPQAVSSVTDVWPRTRGGGQIVAVLDTAVDTGHPELAGAMVPGTDVTGQAADPSEWHGTGVAGVIAARADNGMGGAGMAPESRVMPVRVCTNSSCASSAVARGILWAADHGADVINLSLAGRSYSDVTAAAVQYALSKNISVVASAGNEGLDGNPVSYPAANSGVIAVSATTGAGAPASWAVHGWQVDVSTVGEHLLTTFPEAEYAGASGTSFSGPAVAGAVALLRSSHPGISTEALQAALQAGANSTSGWNRAYGAGRLDMPAAFAAADRTDPAPTVTPSSGSVTVSWSAVTGATDYAVRVDGVVRATVTGTSATISGLLDGQQVAVDVQPSSGIRSAPVLATVGPAPPVAPALGSVATLSGTSTSASVTLTASTTGTDTGRYSLVRDGVSLGTYALSLSATPTNKTFAIGAMPTHSTRWQLRAVDSLARTSAPSNEAVAGSGMPLPPAAPTGLTGRADGGDVLLTWDDLGEAYTYRVSVGGSVVATPRTAGVTLAAPVGERRTYAVTVVDRWGQVGPATAVAVTPTGATAPAAPGSVAAVAGDRSITVSWAAPVDNGSPITGYRVTARPGGATATTTGGTTATLTGLTNGTAYEVAVTATNDVGTGPAGAVSGGVTPVGPHPITAAHQEQGGDGGPLGAATGALTCGLRDAGCFQVFAGGAVYWSPTTGAQALTGSLRQRWSAQGWENGPLGYPVTRTSCGLTGGGCYQHFQRGSLYATSSTAPAYVVQGSQRERWAVSGWERGPLGFPTSDTVCGLRDGGCFQHFQSGSVYSSATTGVRLIGAAVRQRWGATGWENGRLGYPVTDERCGLPDAGCFVHFQGGSVYASAATGAHDVVGHVRNRWAASGWERGPLGYPVNDTVCGLRDGGCFQHFQRGSVYWSPATGARMVDLPTRGVWASTGWETGALGYPVTDQRCGLANGGCFVHFQGGSVYTSTAAGSHAVMGWTRDAWAASGWENGPLGYPVEGRRFFHDGESQRFQGGTLRWDYRTGRIQRL